MDALIKFPGNYYMLSGTTIKHAVASAKEHSYYHCGLIGYIFFDKETTPRYSVKNGKSHKLTDEERKEICR